MGLILTVSSGMSFNVCLSASDTTENDLSVKEDVDGLEFDLCELKTPAVEQLLEKTFPTPVLGNENFTCFSPPSFPEAEAPCDDIPVRKIVVELKNKLFCNSRLIQEPI